MQDGLITPTSGASRPSPAGDPFFGGGEAGAILRAIDWAKKSIGSVESWPQSLRTALSICLVSRHPICIIWGPERIYFYNDAYTPILGEKHPWALGESYITVWPEIWESSIRPILEMVEATGEASWCDDLLLVLRRHGYNEECYFSFSFAPTRIEDGSVAGVFTAITETTAKVIGERRLRTLRDLGAQAPNSTSAEEACRIAGEVLAVNALDVPFALFYLISSDGRLAERVEQVGLEIHCPGVPEQVSLSDEGSADLWQFSAVIRSGKPVVRARLSTLVAPMECGPWPEPIDTAVVLPIVRPGESVPYGFVVLGATTRRPLDSDYHTFFETIASHVAMAVSNARAHAEERRRSSALAELDRAKTDFFSNVSHEFRTPLTLMLGPLEELMGGHTALPLESDVRERLETTHRNSLRLLKLVNTLLDFSRIEAGRLDANYEPVDLPELTAELAAVFRSAVENAGLRFIVHCEPAAEPAYVDRDLWEKIVFNLLSNACKFTHEGEIEVTLRQTGDVFELRVRDTGIGIAPENQAGVFKRFHRVEHARSRTHEGSGIGLSLVQELARLHGGTVELESELDRGSTFMVKIPAGRKSVSENASAATTPARTRLVTHSVFVDESLPAAAGAVGEQVRRDTNSAERISPRILLADDNADMRAYVQGLLRDRYDVVAVQDGNAALAVMREWRPDLVLADVMMPRLDGFALIAALRADPQTKTIPVILLSARAGEASRVEGLEAGADDYLTKPFGARELLARVKSHLHLAEVRRRAAAQLSASAARFERLVAMMPAGVMACDAAGIIIFFNRRAAEIWRARPEPQESYPKFAERFRMVTIDGSPVPTGERHFARALRDGVAFENEEALMERPDGTRFVSSFNISPTFDTEGAITGVIIVFQDVTAERNAQVALQETQERYRAVFQQAGVGIFEVDLRGQIVRSNPAFSRIMGFTAEELVKKNWRDLAHPEEVAAEEKLVGRLLRSEIDSINAERRYLRRDGSFGWVDVFATLIRDPAGAPSHGLAVVVDISERKRAEAGLRETEERFRLAADNAPVLIWIADTSQHFTWFNQPWLDFVGQTLEHEAGDRRVRSIHPEDQRRYLTIYGSAFVRRETFSMEYRLRRHDGEYRWILDRGVPRYQGTEFAGYIGSCIDITERRAAEEAMNESRNAERARRQELEVLTQVAPAGIWMAHDAECGEITGNAAACAMLRMPTGGNLSRSVPATAAASGVVIRQHGKPIPNEELAMRVAGRTGQAVLNQELEFYFPDGTSTWVYGSATPLIGENGKVRGVICVMLDVTERKRAEAALRLSEEQLRLVTDHTSVMLARIDRDHRYRFVNRTYAERYDRLVEEFIGLHVSEVIGPEPYRISKPQIEKAFSGLSTQFEIFYPDIGCWGHVVYEPERTSDGAVVGLVAVVVDITHRKQAEIELKRARDEALAASRAKDDFLAALSHELRTPLSPVLLLASEAAADAELPAQVRADFETIRKSVELEARLIDDLLDLTRITRNKLVLELSALDLSVVVRDALTTVAAELAAKQIVAKLNIALEPAWVWGDAVRLQQVFWNILKNAVKFTPPSGNVNITCRVDEASNEVVVEISDTGIGITPRELERVFEAFSQGDHAVSGGSHRFGGLGLGLAISRRVVELHRGEISAESAGRDHGATFRVKLPVLKRAAGNAPHPTASDGDVVSEGAAESEKGRNGAVQACLIVKQPGNILSGRILLVEDHAPTRAALEQLLLRRKYEVRSAGSTAEARVWAQQESFTLLISDIGLPDGNGYDLMKEFHAQYGMMGISLTGYGMEEDVSRSREAGFVQHLTKPVRVQSLDSALASVSPPAKPQ